MKHKKTAVLVFQVTIIIRLIGIKISTINAIEVNCYFISVNIIKSKFKPLSSTQEV